MMKSIHVPVMLEEVLEFLEGDNKSLVVDCTFGGGGHAREILNRYPHLKVIGLDRDLDAIRRGKKLEEQFGTRISLFHSNYKELSSVLKGLGIGQVDAILLDLGISSDLLSDGERGFSFQKDGPLDMRMDQTAPLTAEMVLNSYPKERLEKIFFEFGEESRAKKIAKVICEQRKKKKITTTSELAELIQKIVGYRGRIHPATKIFQALRIEVNDELGALKKLLTSSPDLLSEGGRLLVISFHSLEDRIVKNLFKDMERAEKLKVITKKPVVPKRDEILKNPRARSAKLRVAEKISGGGTQ